MEKVPRKAKKASDSRPLHDASFLKEQARALFKTLVTHAYPFPISVAQILTPNRTEVWTAASFLLRSLHSEKTVRTWSELSTVAREVGYPFPITQGAPATNMQSLLGFLFWLCDLLAVLERATEQSTSSSEIVTQYLLSSYSLYMSAQDESHLAEERQRLFAEARQRREALAAEKAQLLRELGSFEEKPSQPKLEVEKLEAENQRFLVMVIAPLDEQRKQLLARTQTHDSVAADLARAKQVTSRLEAECKELAEERSALTAELGELPDLGIALQEAPLEAALHSLQEELQELEHADLSLRAELELAEELRDRLELASECARLDQLKQTLQHSFAAAQAETECLRQSLQRLKSEYVGQRQQAEAVLRSDVEFLTREAAKLASK